METLRNLAISARSKNISSNTSPAFHNASILHYKKPIRVLNFGVKQNLHPQEFHHLFIHLQLQPIKANNYPIEKGLSNPQINILKYLLLLFLSYYYNVRLLF